jgi:DUF1680 family protein
MNTKLHYSEASIKRDRDVRYLMELKNENLLFSFYAEAGLNGNLNYKLTDVHWGWDSPLSQIRGTFTGHWMSAAARIFHETGNEQLKAKADYIVSEIERCQIANGGEWAFPIPEKHLTGLKRGQQFWAPFYVCHKVMMGLLDMYQFAGNETALRIIKGCADWFYAYIQDIDREHMDDIMDVQETGGIMEFWADLYDVTKDEKHLALMRAYERPRLYEPISRGEDVLTNMHANTTIPEIHGCARAYEVSGEERYRTIVKNYWDLAVTRRGIYATGGQTDGEVWTPMNRQASRLSETNQEHCVVYNMIRLADYLFRFSGEKKYLDYIELNIENGLYAQGFWEEASMDTLKGPKIPEIGIVSYYLPLAAGSSKKWGSKTEDFWCCHCTAVQANAKYREFISYINESEVVLAQLIPAEIKTQIGAASVTLDWQEDGSGHDCMKINDAAIKTEKRPEYKKMLLTIKAEEAVEFTVKIRIPWWSKKGIKIYIDGKEELAEINDGFCNIRRTWKNEKLELYFSRTLSCFPLADEKETVAFMDGPVVLAGLTDKDYILYGDIAHPEEILIPHHERRRGDWNQTYKTKNQPMGIKFMPLKEIGKETYTVYFPVKKVN